MGLTTDIISSYEVIGYLHSTDKFQYIHSVRTSIYLYEDTY